MVKRICENTFVSVMLSTSSINAYLSFYDQGREHIEKLIL